MQHHQWPATVGSLQYISPPPTAEWMQAKRTISLLGSTGSIGVSALQAIEAHAPLFEVVALAGAFNIQLLAEQAAKFRPQYLAVYNEAGVDVLHKLLRPLVAEGYRPHILHGKKAYEKLAALDEINTVLSAQVGAAGLLGTVAAATAGKVICLANKESLVLAGTLLRHICHKTGAVILPVDSEHNALFQMLKGRADNEIKKLILTASGGPFRQKTREELAGVTRDEALKHPNWAMGAKITIDSATLMNKGLEVIEAHHLYGLEAEKLDVVVHPQSIIHSFVEYQDNSLFAHLGMPDMRMPILHCLAFPHCLDSGVTPLNLLSMGDLTFTAPDREAFPCLALAEKALRLGQDACVVLNAANEVAVELFLDKRIEFMQIAEFVHDAIEMYENMPCSYVWQDLDAVSLVLEHIQTLDSNTRRTLRARVNIRE